MRGRRDTLITCYLFACTPLAVFVLWAGDNLPHVVGRLLSML